MKAAVLIVRILVGVLFIFSGLVKANDPSGLAYKMDEYFAVWGWDWASNYSFALSIAMNVFEIVAGVALLLGWQASINTLLLLLLIVFFTYLTGYAVFSGKIKTCGCFGDCIPLQAHQSFIKDLVLLALILFLYNQRKYIQPFLPLRANLFLLLFSLGLCFWGQLHVLRHLPVVDCLPYAAGNNLIEKMQPPKGSIPDSVVIMYTYTKDGNTVSFDANSFPEDFDEDSYTYVGRENKVVRKGNATPPIQDLAWITQSGTDTTKALLENSGPYLLWFARNLQAKTPEWHEMFNKIFLKARNSNIPLYIVTNQPKIAQEFFNENRNYKVPVLQCDGTVMKSMLRTETGIVAMNGAVVKSKWAEEHINDVVAFINRNGFQ